MSRFVVECLEAAATLHSHGRYGTVLEDGEDHHVCTHKVLLALPLRHDRVPHQQQVLLDAAAAAGNDDRYVRGLLWRRGCWRASRSAAPPRTAVTARSVRKTRDA